MTSKFLVDMKATKLSRNLLKMQTLIGLLSLADIPRDVAVFI